MSSDSSGLWLSGLVDFTLDVRSYVDTLLHSVTSAALSGRVFEYFVVNCLETAATSMIKAIKLTHKLHDKLAYPMSILETLIALNKTRTHFVKTEAFSVRKFDKSKSLEESCLIQTKSLWNLLICLCVAPCSAAVDYYLNHNNSFKRLGRSSI